MANDLGTLIYTLKLDDTGFSSNLKSAQGKVSESSTGMTKTLGEAEKATSGLGKAFGSMAGQFVVGQAVFTLGQKALEAVTGVINDGINAAKEWQTQQAGLNQVLKSTGDASGMTASEIKKLAQETEDKTAIDKAAVLTGQNMLLTFTNIGKDVFPAASNAMTDMATRMNGGLIPNGQMLSSTAIQLGKALNDPTTGLNALHRVGVTFTQQQKDQIKTMQAAGDMAGAQGVIIKELNKEFGGQAAANLHTWTGQWAVMKDTLADVVEAIIDHLVPVLKAVGEWILEHKPVLFALIGAFTGLAIAIGVAVVAALWGMVTAAVAAVIALWPIIAIGAAIGAIGYLIISNWSGISKFFADTFAAIGTSIDWLKNHFWEMLGQVLGFFATLPIMMPFYVIQAFVAIFNFIKSINWGQVWQAIGNAFKGMWDNVVTMAKNAWSAITKINWGQILVNIGKGIGNAIIDIINGAIKGAFSGIPILKDHIPKIPHFAGGTDSYPGGWGVMNEIGGELVKLPNGSQIVPADKTAQMMGGKTYNFDGANFNFHTKDAVDEFFSIGNRNIALETTGISPLAGTVGA